jgi:ribose 5-phosphate isomerase B
MLRSRGHDVMPAGALAPGTPEDWPSVGRAVGEAVVSGNAEFGIACCWTGTGVSIAANKVAGVRAALCGDAATAAGAREWNDANVLCLSMRATTVTIAAEIIDAWMSAKVTAKADYLAMIETL